MSEVVDPVFDKTDGELVVLARAGNRDAFAYLIERYQLVAKSIAMRMVSNEDIARELVQESTLQAFLSLDHLRENERFKSWFYGIVLNVCRTYLRKHKFDLIPLDGLTVSKVQANGEYENAVPLDPQDVVEKRELHSLVLSAVDRLSPGNRQAVYLFYYQHLSLQEVAEILDVSLSAIKVRLHRSREQMRQQLLQIYPEIDWSVSEKQRRSTMIKCKIADVVVLGEHHIVVLLDEAQQHILPIWIGEYEAISIATGLRKFATPRPRTHRFAVSLIESLGAELEEARVEALKEEIFYGIAKLRRDGQVLELDGRPSDILALAVQTESPIYIGEEVMERAGIDISDKNGAISQLGKGIDELLKGFEEQWRGARPRPKASPEEERECSRRKLIEHLFGVSD